VRIQGDFVEITPSAGRVGVEGFDRQRFLLAILSFYRTSKELLQSKPAAAREAVAAHLSQASGCRITRSVFLAIKQVISSAILSLFSSRAKCPVSRR
jgi:hypothetical protein